MVLRAGPLLTAVAIGATGSDPHLLALQDQPPEKDDTDAKSKPPDTVLVPKQPDFPPPCLHVIGAPAMGRPAAPLAAMGAWEAPLQAIGARSAGNSSSSSVGRKQPRLQMLPKSKHRKQLSKPRLSPPERVPSRHRLSWGGVRHFAHCTGSPATGAPWHMNLQINE